MPTNRTETKYIPRSKLTAEQRASEAARMRAARREEARELEAKRCLEAIAPIALKMGFETLETLNSDSADFREVAVWSLKEALEAAYAAGKASK